MKPKRYHHEMAFMMIILILPVMVYGLWLGLVPAAPKEEEKIETAYGGGTVSTGADQLDEDQILFIRQVLKLQKI